MTTVFISGSISIKELDPKVKICLDNIMTGNYDIIVGDAYGVDALVQKYLSDRNYQKVKVYHVTNVPRNNIGNWENVQVESMDSPSTRFYYEKKDIAMSNIADNALVIWDGKSTGSMNNIRRMLSRAKPVSIYSPDTRLFTTMTNLNEFIERFV